METNLSDFDLEEVEALAELPSKGPEQKTEPSTKPDRGCSVSGCDGKHWAKGMCSKHFDQSRRSSVKFKKETRKYVKKETQAKPEEAEKPKKAKPLTIDLSEIPAASQIIEAVRTLGERELRPLEFQVAKILSDAVETFRPALNGGLNG